MKEGRPPKTNEPESQDNACDSGSIGNGGRRGIRTHDPLIKSQLLCQLS